MLEGVQGFGCSGQNATCSPNMTLVSLRDAMETMVGP